MNKLNTLVVYATLLFLTFFSFRANGYEGSHDCEQHPIYCQIITNVPDIKRSYAFELSNVIYKITQKHGLSANLFTAILAQESKYDFTVKRCVTGVLEEKQREQLAYSSLAFCKLKTNGKLPGDPSFDECLENKAMDGKVKICTDFGIGQIWHRTADSYEFDIEKLTSDLEYSVEAAAIVLKDFKSMYSKKEKTWWTRYNASSPYNRQKYKELVEVYKNAN